jgi:hypothetical protein
MLKLCVNREHGYQFKDGKVPPIMRVTFHGSSGQNAPGLGAILSKTGNLSLTSRRCSISRPTLRKWVSRYQEAGVTGVA